MNENITKKLISFFTSPKDLEIFLNTPTEDLIIYHFTFGTWIRNNILNSYTDIIDMCSQIGVSTDDLSNVMMYNLHMTLNSLDRRKTI